MKTKAPKKKTREQAGQMASLRSGPWLAGNPPDHGYYLASWGVGENRTVSELWYNPTNGWWTSRGYLQYYDGQRNWGHQSVPGVYAWMPMPAPAPLANQMRAAAPVEPLKPL